MKLHSPHQCARSARSNKFLPQIEVLEARNLLSGDAVLRWNALAIEAAKVDHAIGGPAQQFGPTRTSRALAIVQSAVFDAVNAIDQSYAGYLLDVVAPPDTSMNAAIDEAAHDTLAVLYSAQSATFDKALADDLAAIPAGTAKSNGIALGLFVASHLLALRQNDGSQVDTPYTFGTLPGEWRPDPLHPTQQPLTPGWGNVTPFTLTSGSQFRAPAPPALNSPEYTAAFNEVIAIGGDGVNTPSTRTADQTEAALFWGYDAQPGLCSPPRFYNQIAEAIAQQGGNSLVQNARFFALINLALADAGITVWDTKYFYNLWRPIAAIREAATDGNPNTTANLTWQPLGAPADNGNGTNFTPPFPAYTSGHAGFGGALFKVMADFYGTDNVSFTIVSDEFNTITRDQNGVARPLRPRHFDSFSQAAEENGQSRIYLGIHWSFDKVEGIKQGDEIADFVFQNFLRTRISNNERYVSEMYPTLMHRSGDELGIAFWTHQLDHGMSRTDLTRTFEHTPEYDVALLHSLYLQYLGRQIDAQGQSNFVAFMQSGGSTEQVRTLILGSPEYFTHHGGSVTGFLASLYHDLLGRSLDQGGASSFGQLLGQGSTPLTVAQLVIHSEEGLRHLIDDTFQTCLSRSATNNELPVILSAMQLGAAEVDLFAAAFGSAECLGRITR